MRQVLLQVSDGCGEEVARRAAARGAATLSRWGGLDGDGTTVEVLALSLPNGQLDPLLTDLDDLGPIEASVPSAGVFAFEPPASRPPAELVDVTPRSPVEVFLAGQQSAGSWQGFLSYAVVAGIVVWIGLYTERSYLLTAAMLLAPFAGPAMNTAIAVSSGDRELLRQSVLRYLAGITVTAVGSGVLTLLVGQQRVTGLTSDVLSVSSIAVLLPIAAGAAGATHLVMSEHSSLVSGAAVGMLVAASLAPPAGGLGIAVALGRTDLVGPAVFLVTLQLLGITLVAALVFRLFGLTAGRGRFAEGWRRLFPVALTTVSLAGGALLTVQLLTPVSLQGSSLARTASEIAAEVVDADERVSLLQSQPRLPSQTLPGPRRVILELDVELERRVGTESGQLQRELAESIRETVARRLDGVAAAVDVTIHPAPLAGLVAGAGGEDLAQGLRRVLVGERDLRATSGTVAG